MSTTDTTDIEKQRRLRKRSPEKPRLNLLADRYAEWYLDFCPTGDTTRSELAAEFFEHAAEAARRYVEIEECSRPAPWNGYTRDPESQMWMHKHIDRRKAWAKAIDLLWQYSDGDEVDADALREALVRMSLRRHKDGSRRDRNEEHVFSKAAGIVRDRAGLSRMHDDRDKAVEQDYR
jgi:hypothetical protein